MNILAYNTELHITPRWSFPSDVAYTIQLFLSHWLSDVCQSNYNLEQVAGYGNWRIQFESSEDAIVVKLSDLPLEFAKHINLQ